MTAHLGICGAYILVGFDQRQAYRQAGFTATWIQITRAQELSVDRAWLAWLLTAGSLVKSCCPRRPSPLALLCDVPFAWGLGCFFAQLLNGQT